MTSPIRRSPPATILSSITRWRGSSAALSLLVAALLTPPAEAGITYGRDQLNGATTSGDFTVVCSPLCLPSQTCTTLYDNATNANGTNLCVNKSYPFAFAGDWQPSGRNYQVGDVVTDPATGEAYLFVDVTVSTAFTNFFGVHPPLSDANSWQPFSGLVSDLAGTTGPQGPPGATGPQGPAGTSGANGANGVNGAPGAVGPTGTQGAPGVQGNKGDKGDTGPMGPQGAVSPAGLQGAAGLPGAQGAMGLPGAVGATGPAGSQGVQGPKGDTGAAGAAGATGASGVGIFPGAMVLVPKGVTVPAGFTCAAQTVRFRHDDESDVDHHREIADDDATRWFRLCSKN